MTQSKKIPLTSLICAVLIIFWFIADSAWAGGNYLRTSHVYTIPDVTLVNQDNDKISLQNFLHSDKPIFLEFIYGTCTTICPILSIGFSHFQKKLGQQVTNVQLVSVSIDPDNDTPEAMKKYLAKYKAKPGWQFLSGNRADVIQVMKAFDAYVTNKMDHTPLTFILSPGDDEWVRINGLMRTADLLAEYQRISGK